MNRNLIIVAVSIFIWGVGETSFFFFQPLYLEELGADLITIGAILGASGVVLTLTNIPIGYLADRYGRKKIMVAMWFIGIVCALAMAVSTSLLAFAIAMIAYRAVTFAVAPLNSYITAARGEWSVTRSLTTVSAMFYLGAVIGPALGGVISDRYGLRQSYWVAMGFFMVSTILILFIQPQPIPPAPPEQNGRSLLKNRSFIAFLGVLLLAGFAMTLPHPLAPNFLQNERDLSLTQIGQLFSINSLGIVAFHMALSRAKPRLGFILSLSAVGVFALTLWLTASLPVFMFGFFMLGGYYAAHSLTFALAQDFIPENQMGLAYGITETVNAAATILAPVLAGVLYNQNPVWMFPASLLCLVVAAIITVRFTTQSSTPAELGQEKPTP